MTISEGAGLQISPSEFNALKAAVAAGNYTLYHYLKAEYGSSLSALYVPGPTGQGVFGTLSHSFSEEAMGTEQFLSLQEAISHQIASNELSYIESTFVDGYYYLPDIAETIKLEIESWSQLGLEPNSYAGHALAYVVGAKVDGSIGSLSTVIGMLNNLAVSLYEVYVSGDFIRYHGITYDPSELIERDGYYFIMQDGMPIPIGITDQMAFQSFSEVMLTAFMEANAEIFLADGNTVILPDGTVLDVTAFQAFAHYVLGDEKYDAVTDALRRDNDGFDLPDPSQSTDPNNPGGAGGGSSGSGTSGGNAASGGGTSIHPHWAPHNGPMTHPPISPLVLDLDGDGVELTSLDGSNVYFDLDADGFAERTGWVTGGDGMLAHDANGNGRIDDINELFGNATTDGFAVLRNFDSNSDGIIDSADASFGELRIWVDTNSNAVADAGELKSLSEMGIVSIQVNAQQINETIAGNTVSHIASYQRADGSAAEVVDVWYSNDQMASHKIVDDGFSVDPDAALLPDLRGWGNVADLQYAMSMDVQLREAVKDLVINGAELDPGSFRSAFETILAEWTGTTDVSPDSRGAYMDAQHLAVLEAFYGIQYQQLAGANAGTPNPGPNATAELEALYQDLVGSMLTHFVAQLAVANFNLGASTADLIDTPWLALGTLNYDMNSDSVGGTVDGVALLASLLLPEDFAGKVSAISTLVPYLEGIRIDSFQGDNFAFALAITNAFQIAGDETLAEFAGSIAAATAHTLVGGAGDDTLNGSAGNDMLTGAAGNDVLNGGTGSDYYMFNSGDGSDTVNESSGADTLVLGAGQTAANVIFRVSGSDLLISDGTSGD
ncbi:hypothetical protein, partial [Mesorhizobium sp. LjNodule214]|uniref:calcium-binding protein n=1 Tax=Mesorhizobium sp. LjNodule214 TaxID=3342252 RepID=UPI003F50CFBA